MDRSVDKIKQNCTLSAYLYDETPVLHVQLPRRDVSLRHHWMIAGEPREIGRAGHLATSYVQVDTSRY